MSDQEKTTNNENEKEKKTVSNFIRDIINEDMRTNRWEGRVVTRFPPEPNGYLHIGHAKAICIDFGLAEEFGGEYHLRFDDTNPSTEETEYIEAIRRDIQWLGFDWGKHEYYASDYFDQMYEWAIQLISAGKAYVDDQTPEQIRLTRGTLTEPGQDSPYRDRSVAENLELFQRMKNGECEEGSRVLRAKIDMSSPNINMRDPIMYRIMKVSHYRQGNQWKIYPMYDWAHGLEDSIERITHSLCSLEFEDHRPLYDWFLDQLGIYHPRQIEFARLSLSYTVMSKRKLLELVQGNYVSGWDDPRMPTLSGMRRRGYPSSAIRNFCDRIGVAKRASMVDMALLEYHVREVLNKETMRVMAVLKPLKVVITNYPQDQSEELEAINNPEDTTMGSRKVPFSRVLYIEQDDFRENPPKKYYRLAPGREVRLRYAYFIKCVDFVKDPQTGEITELHCTYDPDTKGGNAADGRKVKATLHWVSQPHAVKAQVRLYDYLFSKPDPNDPGEGKDFKSNLNENSLQILEDCYAEPSLKEAKPGDRFQFERLGYFCVDTHDTTEQKPVFNRTVTLRDTWARIEKTK